MSKWTERLVYVLAGIVLMIIVGAVVGGGQSEDGEVKVATPSPAPESETVVEEKALVAEPEPEPEPEEGQGMVVADDLVPEEPLVADEPNEDMEEVALQTLQGSFEGAGDVYFNQEYKLYSVVPTDPAFVDDMLYLREGHNLSEWDYLVNSVVELSSSLVDVLGSGYSVALVNPVNTDNHLILATDGVLVYDAFNE